MLGNLTLITGQFSSLKSIIFCDIEVPEEHIASIFRVKDAEQDTSVKANGKSVKFQRTTRRHIPDMIVLLIITAVRTSNPEISSVLPNDIDYCYKVNLSL
jgi:hypothetical protein